MMALLKSADILECHSVTTNHDILPHHIYTDTGQIYRCAFHTCWPNWTQQAPVNSKLEAQSRGIIPVLLPSTEWTLFPQ